jgi:hypothetical protein
MPDRLGAGRDAGGREERGDGARRHELDLGRRIDGHVDHHDGRAGSGRVQDVPRRGRGHLALAPDHERRQRHRDRDLGRRERLVGPAAAVRAVRVRDDDERAVGAAGGVAARGEHPGD